MISTFSAAGYLIRFHSVLAMPPAWLRCLIIRDHAFFEQPDLKRLLGDNLLQRGRLEAQALDFVSSRCASCIACQATFPGFEELLRPDVILALSNALTAAKLGDGDDAVMPGA